MELQRPSFLWTMVRLPATRCLSEFYHFGISRDGKPDTDAAKVAALAACKDVVFDYISPDDSAHTPAALVHEVYSFVGVVERFEESLVLLASLMHIPLASVLFLKAKDSASGSLDGRGFAFTPHPPLDTEPPAVRRAAASASFNTSNRRDYELHRSANEKMDRMWHANRRVFDSRLTAFRAMVARAAALCGNATQREPCYWNDNGCAFECLDRLFSSKDDDQGSS